MRYYLYIKREGIICFLDRSPKTEVGSIFGLRTSVFQLLKNKIILCAIVFLCLILFAFPSQAQDFPEPMQPKRLVNDFSNLIPDDQEQALENKLRAYNDSTSTQIAIVVVATTQPDEVSDYSFKLAEKWGIGRTSKNNGILILVAQDDHDVFIATGYGMEGTVTDAMAKKIIEENLVPHFKNSEYYEGLNEATDKIIALASGEYQGDNTSSDSDDKKLPAFFFFLLFILFLWLISKIPGIGGGRGGFGGGYGGWGGGFSSGGGSFGGGGSSFGGFGGGSFGGGGAGGKW